MKLDFYFKNYLLGVGPGRARLEAEVDAIVHLRLGEEGKGVIDGLLPIGELDLTSLTIHADEQSVAAEDGGEDPAAIEEELGLIRGAVHELDVVLGAVRGSVADGLDSKAETRGAALDLDEIGDSDRVDIPLLLRGEIAIADQDRFALRGRGRDALLEAVVGLLNDGIDVRLAGWG